MATAGMANAIMNMMNKSKGSREVEVPTQPKTHPSDTMKAIVWKGVNDLQYLDVPRPMITHPKDCIVRVMGTTICGSDLHLMSAKLPTMEHGDILGHEFMGIVSEVGADVKNVKIGDRVVVSANIACGSCFHCERGEFSTCQMTNPSVLQKENYGQNTSALYGFSHMCGGVPGGQAEYVRVLYADVNCLVLPSVINDENAVLLGDILSTSYFGADMGSVKKDDVVAIWGLGPVGLLCARWCQILGAKKVIGIDCVKDRLDLATNKLKIDTINFKEMNTLETLKKWYPNGIDVAIECAGFEYPTSFLHKVEMTLGLETDTADLLTEMITAVRPFGNVSLVGVYVGTCNHFPIGAFMEKGLTLRGGPCPIKKYWDTVIPYLRDGSMDPSFIYTHRGTLKDTPRFYHDMHNRTNGVIKTFLRPESYPFPGALDSLSA